MKNSRQVCKMLDILLTKSDKHFKMFCELLNQNGMSHLVTHYLSDRGKSIYIYNICICIYIYECFMGVKETYSLWQPDLLTNNNPRLCVVTYYVAEYSVTLVFWKRTFVLKTKNFLGLKW